MNPYASHLGDRDPMEQLPETAGQLDRFLKSLGPELESRAPAPGKWSAREVLVHLADSELVFAFRLRQALAEEHHVIQPFDQNKWMHISPAYDARLALAVFSWVRQWNLALLRAVPAEAYARWLTHPERGAMTFRVVVETMAGHDVNHLKQLDRIAAAVR